MTELLPTVVAAAEVAGGIEFNKFFVAALAAIGAGLGIGMLGSKAAEATGRNPGAATPILVLSIILAALIEGVFILSRVRHAIFLLS